MFEELTSEQRAQKTYDAALDSVAIITGTKPEDMTSKQWADVVARNKEHLEIVVAKKELKSFDLSLLKAAIKA